MSESSFSNKLFESDRAFVIIIDNPHLAISSRIKQLTKRILTSIKTEDVVITGNYHPELQDITSSARMISIQPHRHIEDEKEFIDSYMQFSNLELLNNILMPVSKLSLLDVAGYDTLVFAYRASYEIDSSLPDDLHGTYDKVIIVGSSHFNYPFPERIISELKIRKLIDDNTQLIGVPIGPISGPLSPHWVDACDNVILSDSKSLDVLKRVNPEINGVIAPEFFKEVPSISNGIFATTSEKKRLLIDWTFIHNWQLKALLRELIASDIKDEIQVYLTAVSDETKDMLWAKWPHLLEELEPEWVNIGTEEYYSAASHMEYVIGFVFGRDVWVWKKDKSYKGVFVCDFAGWWRAFGFSGPSPIATPAKVIAKLTSEIRGRN